MKALIAVLIGVCHSRTERGSGGQVLIQEQGHDVQLEHEHRRHDEDDLPHSMSTG